MRVLGHDETARKSKSSPGIERDFFDTFGKGQNDRSQLNFISKDQKSSMTVVYYPPLSPPSTRLFPSSTGVQVSLYKDDGFTQLDLENIVSGYINAFVGNKGNQGSSLFGFLKDFPDKRGRASSVNDKGTNTDIDTANIPASNETKKGSTKSPEKIEKTAKETALDKLRALGVEVFDRSANQEMTWDHLAGYYDMKKNMEETIVCALKYPEIYDSIAHETRVVFESNRPKAVLLEGPPGTGVTPQIQSKFLPQSSSSSSSSVNFILFFTKARP